MNALRSVHPLLVLAVGVLAGLYLAGHMAARDTSTEG